MAKTKGINKKLLLKVRDHVLEAPDKINMGVWARDGDGQIMSYVYPTDDREYKCASVGCIAGWACLLSPKKVVEHNGVFIDTAAADFLNISWEQRPRLFYVGDWPLRFRKRLLHDPNGEWGESASENLKLKPGTKSYARVVAARIDHFIATDGAE